MKVKTHKFIEKVTTNLAGTDTAQVIAQVIAQVKLLATVIKCFSFIALTRIKLGKLLSNITLSLQAVEHHHRQVSSFKSVIPLFYFM